MKTFCMKYQILFSGKSKKTITNLSSAELAKRVVTQWATIAHLSHGRLIWLAVSLDLRRKSCNYGFFMHSRANNSNMNCPIWLTLQLLAECISCQSSHTGCQKLWSYSRPSIICTFNIIAPVARLNDGHRPIKSKKKKKKKKKKNIYRLSFYVM